MNAATIDSNGRIEPQRAGQDAPQLRTILLTDLVDSTALVERLGDNAAAELFRAHDRLVLGLQQHWRGRLIDRSDGMLLLFERPIDGLGFALDYNRGLLELGAPHGVELKARAGLHVGEVLTWRNSEESVRVGAKPVEVEGLAKPMAGRLMTMARPGQILLSAVAEPLAHRAARELGERGQHLLWKSHGRWRFKGVPEAQQIFEVGEAGVAPLRTPSSSPKAWRDIPLWRRPAALAAEIAAVAVIAIGIWFITKPQPAIAFNERDWVVLADLRNLTGEPLLDDSLEQAFRISLEQSRHVNVLPDLKTRQTLERMRLAPGTELDRDIASEIAIRDGARAVILPTVAEVGGRVRVSAEVIDPNSQTTVYSDYADGHGAQSALASIDEVTAALREKLGEALESVERDSKPLPKVTTADLDALRAYALGQAASAQSRHLDAAQFFEQATTLDPDFALAHIGGVRAHVASANAAAASQHLDRAIQLRDRLPPRDALYLDAWQAEFGPGHRAIKKWKQLYEMYPDYFAGPANYAFSLMGENRFAESRRYAQAATAAQNPLRGVGYDYLGRAELAQENYSASANAFDAALRLGHVASMRRRASVEAARFRFEEAESLLREIKGADGLFAYLDRISVAVDQGDFASAQVLAAEALRAAQDQDLVPKLVFGMVDAVVAVVAGQGESVEQSVRSMADDALAAVADTRSYDRIDSSFLALSAAYVGQRSGQTDLAVHVLQSLGKSPDVFEHPMVNQLAEIIRARNDQLAGRPEAAVQRLRQQLGAQELFQLRVALRDAYAAVGDIDAALAEDHLVAERRGLAYSEIVGGQVLQTLNVADARLARLRTAEVPATPSRN